MLPSTTSPSDSRRLINHPLRDEESSVSHDPLANRRRFPVHARIKRDSSRSARPRCLEFHLKNEIPRPEIVARGIPRIRGAVTAEIPRRKRGGATFDFSSDISPRDSLISRDACGAKAARREHFWGKEIAFEVTLAGR